MYLEIVEHSPCMKVYNREIGKSFPDCLAHPGGATDGIARARNWGMTFPKVP